MLGNCTTYMNSLLSWTLDFAHFEPTRWNLQWYFFNMCVPFPFEKKENWKCLLPSTNVWHFVYTWMSSAQSYKHYIYARFLSMSSGKMKFDSSSWYVKADLLCFCEDHVRVSFFFRKLHTLRPGSRAPSSKYLRWNKPVDIESSFSSAVSASLTRLGHKPSVSIRQKKSSETQGIHFVKSQAHSQRPTRKTISMILLWDAPFW